MGDKGFGQQGHTGFACFFGLIVGGALYAWRGWWAVLVAAGVMFVASWWDVTKDAWERNHPGVKPDWRAFFLRRPRV